MPAGANYEKMNETQHSSIATDWTGTNLACPPCIGFSLQVVHPADPPGELNVTGEQRDPLGMDGTQIGIGEQHDEKRLCSLGRRGGRKERKESVQSYFHYLSLKSKSYSIHNTGHLCLFLLIFMTIQTTTILHRSSDRTQSVTVSK